MQLLEQIGMWVSQVTIRTVNESLQGHFAVGSKVQWDQSRCKPSGGKPGLGETGRLTLAKERAFSLVVSR